MSRKNVVFIFTDDQRFNTISALGNDEIDTPNLDRLVREGTTFTHAHIMGGTAGAVCMPSRAMLMTGRTLFEIEREGQRIPPEHTAMPEAFRATGYETAHVGKWHQDRKSHQRCFSKGGKIFGFKRENGWYENCNGHWHVPVHDFDPNAEYLADGGYNDPPLENFQQPFETTKDDGKHSCEVFTDEAIEIMRDHWSAAESKDNPLFLYLAHIAPHDPRQYPARLRERYTADKVSLPENFAMRHPFDNGDLYIRDEILAAFPRRPEEIRQHLADYYAIIAHVDEQVGRVLDFLDESGKRDDTIVVFAGDNGLAVGQHGLMGKQSLYEHSSRVPLIMSGPDIPKNQRTDTLCYLLDVFPTLCELTGVPTPDSVQGSSLVPALKDPSHRVRNTLFLGYKGYQRGYREERYKLIEYSVNGERTVQLFDLQNDPLETQNLADSPDHSGKLKEMQEALAAEISMSKDPYRRNFGIGG